MGGKIVHNQSIEKLRINPSTTLKMLSSELKNQYQQKEIQISIDQCEEPNSMLFEISSHFCFFERLISLSIKIKEDQSQDIDVEDLLNNLKYLKNLEYLSLKFLTTNFIKKESEISIGDQILHLSNLKSLKLKINCANINRNNQFLNMQNSYRQLSSLRQLRLHFKMLFLHSLVLITAFEGLGNLTNLESLIVKLDSSNMENNIGFQILTDQLINLKNLKTLKIKDLNIYNNKGYSACQVCFSIRYLKNLENLTLRIPLDEREECCLEGIQNLEFLKFISLYYFSTIELTLFKKYMNLISNCKALVTFHFNCNLNDLPSNQSYLSEISDIILKIPQSTEIQLNIPYNNSITYREFIEFFEKIKHLKYFKKINIVHFDRNTYARNKKEIESIKSIQNFKKISLNLEEINIKVYEGDFLEIQKIMKNNFWISLIQCIPSLKVIKLDLDDENNSEEISKQIFLKDLTRNKQELKEIRLKLSEQYVLDKQDIINFFESLQCQTHITHLILQLDGYHSPYENLIITLSNSLSSFQKLIELVLIIGKTNQSFEIKDLSYLKEGLQNLNCLKQLKLEFCEIQSTMNDLVLIIESLKSIQSLKTLVIKYNMLNTTGIKNKYIKQCQFPQNLKVIILSINAEQLQFEDISSILNGLSQLKKLKFLEFQAELEQLKQEEGEQIYHNLKSIISLQNVYLTINLIPSLHLVKLFRNLTHLQSIFLYEKVIEYEWYQIKISRNTTNSKKYEASKIKDDSLIIRMKHYKEILIDDILILENIFEQYPIYHLDFTITKFNILNDALLRRLFTSFLYLKNLMILELVIEENCNIRTESINQLGLVMEQFSILTHFTLEISFTGNQISLSSAPQFQNGLRNLLHLQNLNFNFSSCTTDDIAILLSQTSKLASLSYLSLIFYKIILSDASFFRFDQKSLLNLKELQFLAKFENENISTSLTFFNSFRYLPSLFILKTTQNLYEQIFKKIPRLVTIIRKMGN